MNNLISNYYYKIEKNITLIFIIISILVFASYLLIENDMRISVYHDDALFYGIVANNTINGHPFSFDGGISKTNGFHWLQMIIVLFIAKFHKLIHASSLLKDFINFKFFIDVFIISILSFFITNFLRSLIKRKIILIFFLILTSQVLAVGMGMETVYVTLFIVIYMLVNLKESKVIWHFLIPFFITFSRFDFFYIAPIIILFSKIFIKIENKNDNINILRRFYTSIKKIDLIFCITGVCSAIIVIFFLNYLITHDPFSSSSLAKSSNFKLLPGLLVENFFHFGIYILIFRLCPKVT